MSIRGSRAESAHPDAVIASGRTSDRTMSPRSAGLRGVLLIGAGAAAAYRDLQVGSVHLFTLICLCLLVMGARGRTPKPLGIVLWVFWAVAMLGGAAVVGQYSNNAAIWLQYVALSVSAVALYVSLRPGDSFRLLWGFVLGVSVSSAVALAQQVGVIQGQLFIDSSGLQRPIGLVQEPDWVGAFAGLAIIAVLRLKLRRWVLVLLLLVNLAALIVSFARAAWLGLSAVAVVAGVLAILTGRRTAMRRAVLGIPALVLCCVIGAAWMPDLAAAVGDRVLSILFEQSRDLNAVYRAQQFATLNDLASSAPWYGYGLGASGRVTAIGEFSTGVSAESNVSSNWVLGLLVDAKLLGIPLVCVLIVLALRRFRHVGGQMLTFVLINSLFSNLLLSPATWLSVGLCMIASADARPVLGNRGVGVDWKGRALPGSPSVADDR